MRTTPWSALVLVALTAGSLAAQDGPQRKGFWKGGFGTGLGAGYEVKIGRNLYLVPAADFLLQLFKKETDPVLGRIPGSNTLLLFNLGLTWH